VAPCGLSSIFLDLPLFMGRTALIFQNRFSISALFRNFGFAEVTTSRQKKNIFFCFALDFS